MQQTDDLAAWLTQILNEDKARAAGPTYCSPVWPSADQILARIEADKQILAHCMQAIPKSMGFLDDVTQARALWAISTVRILALPHADRPGYREEWKP